MSSTAAMRQTMTELGRFHVNPDASEPVLYARPSLAERDRRYKLVRRRMAAEKIDVLILPANHSRWDQMMADSRYLTAIGGFGTETLTIFPREGAVTAGVFNRSGWWKRAQDWIEDVRDCRNRWAELVIERLGELGFRKGRIGVAGLKGLVRAPDGLVPYTTIERVRSAFPGAEIVDATALMQDCRAVKSAEEIRIMRRSVQVIEAMLDACRAEARPGITEKHLYGTMVQAMLDNDGELPSLMIFGTGKGHHIGNFVPTARVLKPGDMIIGEIEAHYCGYSGQVIQPMSLGPQPQAYTDLMAVAGTCFDRILEKMRPGTTMGELMDTYERVIKKEGRGKLAFVHPMMHARGLGDERPAQFGKEGLADFRRIPLKAGMTFVLKPRARNEASRLAAQIGDTVVVTRAGGRRLGTRPLELYVI